MRSTIALPLLALSVAALPTTARAIYPQPRGPVTLSSLRHKARPLLIFAANPDDPQLQVQLRTLEEHASDAADRDIVAIAVTAGATSPTPAFFSAAETTHARRRFRIAPADFTVVLVGKDGGEKLRSSKPFSMQELIDTIDAMPMRQDEMRKGSPR